MIINLCGNSVKIPTPSSGFNITWDGNTEGLEYLPMVDGSAYHVSSEAITAEQLIGSTCEVSLRDSNNSVQVILTEQITEQTLETNANLAMFTLAGTSISLMVLFIDLEEEGITYPKGMYFFLGQDSTGVVYISSLSKS